MFFVAFLLISGRAPASLGIPLTVEDRVVLVDAGDDVQERGVVGTNVITVFLDTARLLVENVEEALLDLGLNNDDYKAGRSGLVAGLMRMVGVGREELEVMLLDMVVYIGEMVADIFLGRDGSR